MTIPLSSISVPERDKGKRLDLFLAERFQDRSRSYFQRLIVEGAVRVNGNLAENQYRIKADDEVTVGFREEEEPSIEPDASVPFRVIADEPDFSVIEKPAGVVVHPSHTHKKGTLVNGLLARWPQIAGVGEDPLRPGIVHRLDKETSGLMVVAKTQPMFVWLKRQFQENKVTKKYIALVVGKMSQMEGEIVVPIARLKTKQITVGRMNKGVSGKVKKSRFASTRFKISGFYDGFSLVEAFPKTGRMHQIRVHFKHIGYPLAGDKTYASRRQQKLLPLERHFLHAANLSFSLPDGQKVEYSSPLPSDLKLTLKGLEKNE